MSLHKDKIGNFSESEFAALRKKIFRWTMLTLAVSVLSFLYFKFVHQWPYLIFFPLPPATLVVSTLVLNNYPFQPKGLSKSQSADIGLQLLLALTALSTVTLMVFIKGIVH